MFDNFLKLKKEYRTFMLDQSTLATLAKTVSYWLKLIIKAILEIKGQVVLSGNTIYVGDNIKIVNDNGTYKLLKKDEAGEFTIELDRRV